MKKTFITWGSCKGQETIAIKMWMYHIQNNIYIPVSSKCIQLSIGKGKDR